MDLFISGHNDMPKVRAQITDMLLRNPQIAREPLPQITILKIEEDNIQIAVRPYTAIGDYWSVYFYTLEGIKELIDHKEIIQADKITRVVMLDKESI